MKRLLRLKTPFIGVFFALLFPGMQAFAGAYLVQGGTVTNITSTSGNTASFGIQVSGGSVNTCVATWINFNQADSPDADTFKRAYAAALLAYTIGRPVNIYNYVDSTCQHASYVELD